MPAMSFRINSNIAALNALNYLNQSQANASESLLRLSSGLRINKAADDASGMSIANRLKAQASALEQGIKNGNDAIGIVQIADKAMDEQINILNIVRTKAIQAASDGQNAASRAALQRDIARLLEEVDNIAATTSYNGQKLLNGAFSNKRFQIGAYANQSVSVSIENTSVGAIGHTRFETSAAIAYKSDKLSQASFAFSVDNHDFMDISGAELKKDGLSALAKRINQSELGVSAKVLNEITFSSAISQGAIKNLSINGVKIGDIEVSAGDANAVLINAINKVKEQTGVEASVQNGRLKLSARDGRAMNIAMDPASNALLGTSGLSASTILGRLSLVRQDARDIVVSLKNKGASVSATSIGTLIDAAKAPLSLATNEHASAQSVSLRALAMGNIDEKLAHAMGYFGVGDEANKQAAGVASYYGAQAMIDVSESALKRLDRIRADLGSTQIQLQARINVNAAMQVNLLSAQSQIRDVDFAKEAANFTKYNLLAQSGSYALAQANKIMENILRLLQ